MFSELTVWISDAVNLVRVELSDQLSVALGQLLTRHRPPVTGRETQRLTTQQQRSNKYLNYSIYTVSTKKVTPCIHCRNSDKQCQILTEFWVNNAMSNCKQITNFLKSVNACNSYRGFSEVTTKQKCPL